MKTNIFVPDRIRVGFNNRSDTYTGQLAYIIYFDAKGKLRKETSWQNWRDKKIEPAEFQNKPTSGFVLNKNAGGGSSYDWFVRQTYIRVYDPRGFEFEITVPNLLFILENTSSIKGKGLEGEFVYGWDGTELVLIPTSSPEYKECVKYTEMFTKPEKISTKKLMLGGTYRTKTGTDLIYLGRFEKFVPEGDKDAGRSLGKHYVFRHTNENKLKEFTWKTLEMMKSISGRIVKTVSETPVPNYADLVDELYTISTFSPIDETKTTFVPYTVESLSERLGRAYCYYGFVVYKNGHEYVIRNRQQGTDNDRQVYFYDRNRERNTGFCMFKSSAAVYTIPEVIEKFKPMMRQRFLASGHKYEEGARYDA